MKKINKNILLATLSCTLIQTAWFADVYASDNDTSSETSVENYNLENMTVYGDSDKTVGNPYITGGDVNVISRQDIENNHYTNIENALKTIPGVQISTPGYRGGEYGYSNYNTELTINGENNIVILIDGRRIDNDANSYAGNKSRVNLSTLPSIENVEQIEVIKGTGSAIYGADTAGGVINIITRKGTAKPKTTERVS